MHVLMALMGPVLDQVTKALFLGGYLGLKSAGVGMSFMTQSQPGDPANPEGSIGEPFFAFDAGPSWPPGPPPFPGSITFPPYTLAGFDMGAWGEMVGVPLPPALAPPSTDANSDGFVYGRENQLWVKAVDPTDSVTAWVANPGATMTGPLVIGYVYPPLSGDAPSDNQLYGRKDQAWVAGLVPPTGAKLTGPLTLAQ
jgi:hypothetical protein